MRFDSLDGLRGFFLILMMHSHAQKVLQTQIGRLSHLDFSEADAAHGFIFLSGLVAGVVYTRRLIRVGEAGMRAAVLGRVRTIYLYHAILVLALLAMSAVATQMAIMIPLLRPFMDDPALTTALALGLSADIDFMDILPMYVLFMACTPLILGLMRRGYAAWVVMGSISLWLLAQTGFSEFITSGARELLVGEEGDIALGIYFDVFGWQLLFVTGLFAGYLVATGRNPAPVVARQGWEPMLYLAAVLFIALAPITLHKGPALLGFEGSGPELGLGGKDDASPIYLVSFLVEAFIITWLLVAGPASERAFLQRLSRGLTAVVTWRPLVFLGQHSLQAFAAHVLYVYVVAFAAGEGGFNEGPASILLLVSPAPMFLAAWLHSSWKERTTAPT